MHKKNLYNKKHYFLNESSLDIIKNKMKKNFFIRLKRASANQFAPVLINADYKLPPIQKEMPKIGKKYQIEFCDKIRKNLFEINKNKKYSPNNSYISKSVNNEFNELTLEYNQQILKNKKIDLPKIEKKQLKDFHAIKLEKNYIDNVEKLYIKPYSDKNNVVYTDYLKNSRSKIPLNIIF